MYGFAAGDPVNFADPFGLKFVYKDEEARRQFDRLKAIVGGMTRSADERTRINGGVLSEMIAQLEAAPTKILLAVDVKQYFVWDVGTRTGEFSFIATGLSGPGINISTTESPDQPVPALLAHELGHAYKRWVERSPYSDSMTRNMNSAENTFSIAVENMVRAAMGCVYSRPLDGHATATRCR